MSEGKTKWVRHSSQENTYSRPEDIVSSVSE